jgi:hypothetical protein
MRRLGLALAFCLALVGCAQAQGGMGPGPGTVHSVGSSYSGPGDVVSGATIWGSCARAYSSATAAGTSMCDLVDSAAPTTVICTLKLGSNGFVDLVSTANCTGSVTPAAKCAAATGGVCNVQKVYDQIGGTSGWIQSTAATQPVLAFNALNSLPGWTCTSAANKSMITTTTFTFSAPYTWVATAKRTANNTTSQAIMGWSTAPNGYLGFSNATNTVTSTSSGGGFATLGSVTDNSFHALQGYIDPSGAAANGLVSADGVDSAGAVVGSSSPSGVTARVCRSAGGLSLDGVMMEAGLWQSQFNGTQRADMNTNIHGTNGYNF